MAKGNRGGKRGGSSGGSATNGFNGQEHAVEVKFDDGTTFLYRIKGTQMYVDNYGSNISAFGNANNNTYDVPVNQAEILMNNAKNNGAKATLMTPKQLKSFDDNIKKQRANDNSDPSLGILSNGVVGKKYRQKVIRVRRGRNVNG